MPSREREAVEKQDEQRVYESTQGCEQKSHLAVGLLLYYCHSSSGDTLLRKGIKSIPVITHIPLRTNGCRASKVGIGVGV